jgi:hypothetical protein
LHAAFKCSILRERVSYTPEDYSNEESEFSYEITLSKDSNGEYILPNLLPITEDVMFKNFLTGLHRNLHGLCRL